jgi:nanoRNase/pAp phosphatase (c-di-AMP/oligoRNAs hydrolase)
MNTNFKKFHKLINSSNKILIVVPPAPNYDILASSFVLHSILSKEKKAVTILSNNLDTIKNNLTFLKQPKQEVFIETLDGSRDFLLIFNTEHSKILDIKIEKEEKETTIRLTPEKGIIDPRDFSLAPADFNYDLAIILGAPSLESLGDIYQKNTDLFFEVPKININNDSENEDYGQINIVDLTASSIAEILSELLFEEFSTSINKETAQMLLTGIISATDSFQKATTTPQSMLLASKLAKAKADQSEIIRHLYKTKALSFLKLWGRAMARLNWDDSRKFIWSLVSTEDFLKSRAEENIIPAVLEELQKNYTKARIFGIFYGKNNNSTYGRFTFENSRVLEAVAEEYDTKPTGNTLEIEFKNKNLVKAEKDFSIALSKNL